MVSIQGRTYHTMLNSAQPHSTLNNNISWWASAGKLACSINMLGC
jgi:hypothetical protein